MAISLIFVVLAAVVTSAKQEFKCKARRGCHFSGCDPVQSLSFAILDRNEFPITCETSEQSEIKKLSQDNKKLKTDFAKFVAETEAKLKNLENQIKLLSSTSPTVASTAPPVSSHEGTVDSAPPIVATSPSIAPTTTTKVASDNTNSPSPDIFYHWTSWVKTFCSTTCGSGMQARSRACVDASTGKTASTSQCKGSSYNSDLSCFNECVDDKKYLTKFKCDFQTEGDMCGLTNSDFNDVNWIQNFGNLPHPFTNPIINDTEGYIYVDAPPKNTSYVFSRVMTPRLAVGKYCIETRVFMTTDGVGYVKVQARAFAPWTTLNKRPKTLYSRELSTNRWVVLRQDVSIGPTYRYMRVDFEAWRSANSPYSKPTMVIDVIHINPGKC